MAGIATRPRGCCISGRIGPPSRPCGSSPPDRSRPVGRAHALSALAGLGALEPGDVAGRARRSRPARPRPRPAAGGAVLPADERDRKPDGGDGRRRRPDGPLPARVLAGRAAGRTGRGGAGRPGGPRRGRSLDAAGDPQLGDDLHRRGLHAAGRRRRLPGLGARPCLPDGPGRADRRGGSSRRPGRDPRGAGRPAGRRAGPGPRHRPGLDGRRFPRGAGAAGRCAGRPGPVDPRRVAGRRPHDRDGRAEAGRRADRRRPYATVRRRCPKSKAR